MSIASIAIHVTNLWQDKSSTKRTGKLFVKPVTWRSMHILVVGARPKQQESIPSQGINGFTMIVLCVNRVPLNLVMMVTKHHYIGYFLDEDKICCRKCIALKQNIECGICGLLIESEQVFAMNQYLHSSCFKCTKCNEPLRDQVYLAHIY